MFAELPNKKYGTILCDPPWRFEVYGAGGEQKSASRHYKTIKPADIAALPVADIAARDSILFLWTTDTHLADALKIIDAWGFKFKTVGFYWIKTTKNRQPDFYIGPVFPMGLGYWTRANPEQCLLATRGHPKRLARNVRRLVVAPRREHSRKPDEVPEAIQRLVAGPYLELFARTARPGWDVWGDETGRFPPIDQGDGHG